MASSKWEATEKGNGLVLSYGELSAPISRQEGLKFAGTIVTLCGGGKEVPAMNASKTATAATPAGRGRPKSRTATKRK